MRQLDMLRKAMKKKYIVPAFNFANFEILKGLLQASDELKSPMILQVSESAMNYFGDEILAGIVAGLKKRKNISIHLDHGKNFDTIMRAIRLGFDSVMIDGSTLPFNENVRLTKKVVDFAHKRKVMVEGELGVLAMPDDDATAIDITRFTDPNMAKEFVSKTGVDSLAISIGTNHGVNKYISTPQIRFDILSEIEKAIPNTPLVLHGASLVEEKYLDSINKFGGNIKKSLGNNNLLDNVHKTNICKVNMDTDFRLAYTAAVRRHMSENASDYCPRTYGKAGIKEVKQCAIDRILNICHIKKPR
ncbi:MAG: class II fructose-bisphosphate aldolase [Clostridia bacterium]|nr:class II fructose-bisphosphate aldolase [Clostridia bacterium]